MIERTCITLSGTTSTAVKPPPAFTPVRSPSLQRQACESCEDDLKKKGRTLQRFPCAARNYPGGSAVPGIVQEVLSTSGQPLETKARARMEPSFQHDFSREIGRAHV